MQTGGPLAGRENIRGDFDSESVAQQYTSATALTLNKRIVVVGSAAAGLVERAYLSRGRYSDLASSSRFDLKCAVRAPSSGGLTSSHVTESR